MGWNGGQRGEAAEGTGTGLGRGDAGGGGEDKRYEDNGRDVWRDDDDGATGPSDDSPTATAGRGSRRDGGGGVVASSADDGRDVGRSDDAKATQDWVLSADRKSVV